MRSGLIEWHCLRSLFRIPAMPERDSGTAETSIGVRHQSVHLSYRPGVATCDRRRGYALMCYSRLAGSSL